MYRKASSKYKAVIGVQFNLVFLNYVGSRVEKEGIKDGARHESEKRRRNTEMVAIFSLWFHVSLWRSTTLRHTHTHTHTDGQT